MINKKYRDNMKTQKQRIRKFKINSLIKKYY